LARRRVMFMLSVMMYVVSYKLLWCCAICIWRSLFWQRICNLTLFPFFFS